MSIRLQQVILVYMLMYFIQFLMVPFIFHKTLIKFLILIISFVLITSNISSRVLYWPIGFFLYSFLVLMTPQIYNIEIIGRYYNKLPLKYVYAESYSMIIQILLVLFVINFIVSIIFWGIRRIIRNIFDNQ